ncbi:Protein translocase subunit SecA [Dirofilaria immitis]
MAMELISQMEKIVSSINGESKSLPTVAVPIYKGRRNRGPNIISESDATAQHNRDKKQMRRFFEIMMWHSWIIIIALINHTLFITACKKTFGSCAWPIGQRAKLPSEGL